MNKEQRRQFFARKKSAPNVAKVGGKFSFSRLPKVMQENIKKKLAEKDDVMAEGIRGALPGIKINGKQVTKDNIKDFEKKPVKEKIIVKEKKLKEIKYTKLDLKKLSFSELKKIAKKFGQTGRSRTGLIKDILKSQK